MFSLRLLGMLIIIILSFDMYSSEPEKVLKIQNKFKLDIPEISGMCWKKNNLVIVSDSEDKIYILDFIKEIPKIKKIIDLKKIAKGKSFKGGQWESIYSDESGRLFLLQEFPTKIFIINEKLDKIDEIINLSENKKIKWKNKKNSLGEGLLLLKNGHLLISKEKKPFKLMEFVSGKDKAEGYRPSLSIEVGGKFPALDSLHLEPRHYWELDVKDRKIIEDVSGINIDQNGSLYLLSDKSNLIADLGKIVSVDNKKIVIKKIYKLPSEIKKAEGMVFDKLNRPIIVIDSKKKDVFNFFILDPLK